jgi:carbon monoxide dehydrogenase subunit G
MNLSGEKKLTLKLEKVWDALNNTNILQKTIPGCLDIKNLSKNEMLTTVQAKIGPINTKFKGQISISNIDLHKSYKISGKGNGAAGFASGSAQISFKATNDGTLLNYEVEANVGGKLAQIGSRLIQSTANKLTEEFFENLETILNNEEQTIKPPSPSLSEKEFKIPQIIWVVLISGFSIFSLWYFNS